MLLPRALNLTTSRDRSEMAKKEREREKERRGEQKKCKKHICKYYITYIHILYSGVRSSFLTIIETNDLFMILPSVDSSFCVF